MDTSQIVRGIQIDLILGNQNPIIEWFNGIWNDLSVIETDVYHKNGGEIIYYNSENLWIFYRDDKSGRFWCNFERYWAFLEAEFNPNYKSIQVLTKVLVDEALNDIIVKPINVYQRNRIKVGEALDNIIATPRNNFCIKFTKVGEALDNIIGTPKTTGREIDRQIEEELNKI